MIDIASSLFQIERRVNQKKDDAWMEEAQNLLNQLARSEHEKSEYNALVRALRDGTKNLSDIQIMEDGSIRYIDRAEVTKEEIPCNPVMAESIARSKNGQKETASAAKS